MPQISPFYSVNEVTKPPERRRVHQAVPVLPAGTYPHPTDAKVTVAIVGVRTALG